MTTTYISVLRGINVSGHKLIRMPTLKSIYDRLGYTRIQSYLQTGNIIFSSKEKDTKKIAAHITEAIQDTVGFDVPVIVLSREELRSIIEKNPFRDDEQRDISCLHVTFLAEAPPADTDQDSITDKRKDGEEIEITPQAAYLYCPHGYGKTRLNNNFLEKTLKTKATTRHWRTTQELLKLADDASAT